MKGIPVIILHLSDLHFGWDGSQSERDERKLALDGLFDFLGDLNAPWRPNCVCISGDIGWKGKASDYKEAELWIKKLVQLLNIPLKALFLCPGNHDIDRDIARSNSRPHSPEEADLKLAVPIQHQLTTPFKAFNEFCQNLDVPPYGLGEKTNFLVGWCSLKKVNFVSINSGWFSKDGDRGNLWIGQPQIKHMEVSGQLPPPYLIDTWDPIIAFFHHPREYLSDAEIQVFNNRPNTFDYLSQRCHLLLTGHTHGEVRRPDMFGGGAWHLSGGAAYAGASHFNSFRIIQVEKSGFCCQAFEYNPGAADHPWRPAGNEQPLPRRWQIIGPHRKTRTIKSSKVSRAVKKEQAQVEICKGDRQCFAKMSFMLFFPDGLLRAAYRFIASKMASKDTASRAEQKKIIVINEVKGTEMVRLSPDWSAILSATVHNRSKTAIKLLSFLDQWIIQEIPFQNISSVGVGRAILIRDLLSIVKYLSARDQDQPKSIKDIYQLANKLLPQIIDERHIQTAYEISKRLFELPEFNTPLSCLIHARLLMDMGEPEQAADILDMFRGDDLFAGYELDDITRIELALDWAKATKDAGYGRKKHSDINNVYNKALSLLSKLRGAVKKDPRLYRLEAGILQNRATQNAVFGRATEWTRARADYKAAGVIYKKLKDKANLIAVHANLVSHSLDHLGVNASQTTLKRLLSLLGRLRSFADEIKPSEEVFFFFYQIGRLKKRIYKKDPRRAIEPYKLAYQSAHEGGLSYRAPIAQRWVLRLSKQSSLIHENEYIRGLQECANALKHSGDAWAASTYCDISIELALNYLNKHQIIEAWNEFTEAFDVIARQFVRSQSTAAQARLRTILMHMDRLKMKKTVREVFLSNRRETCCLLLGVSIHKSISWANIKIWLRNKEEF